MTRDSIDYEVLARVFTVRCGNDNSAITYRPPIAPIYVLFVLPWIDH